MATPPAPSCSTWRRSSLSSPSPSPSLYFSRQPQPQPQPSPLQILGGLVDREKPEIQSISSSLTHSNYQDIDYWANNFNDMGSAMVTCFELLVVNNWFLICQGYSQVP